MKKELIALRKKMQENNIDIYLIPTTDFHGSEYVNDYFKCREFISGFTGSAGTLIVTADWAGLWTDGRYFLQAEAQLSGSGIELMKMGEPEVPTIEEYLTGFTADTVLGFDGRVVNCAFAEKLTDRLNLCQSLDLVGEIWENRPEIKPSTIYPLPDSVTGKSFTSKLAEVRESMETKGADYHLMTSLEEIAWLYNLRGSDVKYTPVFFAFALITQKEAKLYIMDERFDALETLPYFRIFEDLAKLKPGKILLDKHAVSFALVNTLPKDISTINDTNPSELLKALKNPIEIAATKKAHLEDGAAMVNFLYWLKTNIGKIPMTEISASDYLKNCRDSREGFFDLSFDTISGYGANGAIIHYSATPGTCKTLHPDGFLLVDSGGQYETGTTDITRTISLGPLSYEMKRHYTLVLRSHIQLAMARFQKGTTGAELDKIARKPLHDEGLDFNHGTGHGVGHILSVHEDPNTISPRGTASPILPGMITSDEPGLYFEGKYGIRLENEILCVKKPDGSLRFEPITFCPFDSEAILPEMLLAEERAWLNDYHKSVFEKISPMVDKPVRKWLEEATAKI